MIVKITTHNGGKLISTGTPGFTRYENTSIATITIEFPADNKVHETDEFKTMWESIELLGKKHFAPNIVTMPAPKLKPTYIYRSAKTGRIVTEKWAKKHPSTTVRETVKGKK